MRRAILNTSEVLQAGYQQGGFRRKAALLTLTYRDVDGWRPKHISAFLHCLRQWANRRDFLLSYVGVAELQKRGAVHYHLIVWLPKGVSIPKPDKQGWWPHGLTKIEWARRPVGYLVKYASKGDAATDYPKGLRLHVRGGLSQPQRRVVSWWLLPRYVRSIFTEVATRVRRASGGGWVNLETGEWIPSWKPPPPSVAMSGAA